MSASDTVGRSEYIGGSDAGAIFGLNKFRPRSWVVRQKVLGKLGEWKDRDLSGNPHIQRGNEMEPLVQSWVRDNLDPSAGSSDVYDELTQPGDPAPEDGQVFLYDPKLGVGGHPDDVGDEIVHEYKATTTRSLERVHRAGARRKHLLQTHHYLWLTGRPIGMLHYWNYNSWKPLTFTVERRPDLYEKMQDEYDRLWEEVESVLAEAEIAVESGADIQAGGVVVDDRAKAALADRAREAAEKLGPLGGLGDVDTLEQMATDYEDAKSTYYDANDQKKELKAKLLTALDGKDQIVTPNLIVSAVERRNAYSTYHVVKVSKR